MLWACPQTCAAHVHSKYLMPGQSLKVLGYPDSRGFQLGKPVRWWVKRIDVIISATCHSLGPRNRIGQTGMELEWTGWAAPNNGQIPNLSDISVHSHNRQVNVATKLADWLCIQLHLQ